jgi:hypothetical protein
MKKFLSDTLRKKEKAHVLDDKFIPASNIEVSWAMGYSFLHSVPTWFLAHTAASKIRPL